jgi:hypothetical protein
MIDWLNSTNTTVPSNSVHHFMIQVFKYQKAAFPLNWIAKFKLNDSAILLTLVSQEISDILYPIVIAHAAHDEIDDLCVLLKASGDHLIFVEWLMMQYKRTRDDLRYYLEINLNKALIGIDEIAKALQREVELNFQNKS